MYAYNYFNYSYISQFRAFTSKELVQQIQKGRSFIRLGDGEIHLMNGGSIHYELYNQKLENMMRNLVKEYTNDSPYIIGLPFFLNMSNTELRKIGQLRVWMPLKVMYQILFSKKTTYADAHFFYYNGFFEKYLESYLINKHIIVITRKDTIESLKNNPRLPFKNISYVISPNLNSYLAIDLLLEETEAIIKNIYNKKNIILLVAIGPASKGFVYEFSKKGLQAIDIGVSIEYIYQDKKSLEVIFPVLKKISFFP